VTHSTVSLSILSLRRTTKSYKICSDMLQIRKLSAVTACDELQFTVRSRKSSETARRAARRRRAIPRLISIYRAVDNDEAVRAFGHSLNSARGLIRPTSSGMTRIHCARDDERTTLWAAQSRLIAADAPRCSSRTIYEGPLIRMNEQARAARTGRRCNAHPESEPIRFR